MGTPADFPGANLTFGPPLNREEDIGSLRVFMNGTCVVSAWDLTDAEIAEVVRTRRVFVSLMTGMQVVPQYIGSESTVRAVVVDYGKIW